jgi:hypothetical protein
MAIMELFELKLLISTRGVLNILDPNSCKKLDLSFAELFKVESY